MIGHQQDSHFTAAPLAGRAGRKIILGRKPGGQPERPAHVSPVPCPDHPDRCWKVEAKAGCLASFLLRLVGISRRPSPRLSSNVRSVSAAACRVPCGTRERRARHVGLDRRISTDPHQCTSGDHLVLTSMSYPFDIMTPLEVTGTEYRGLAPHKITPMLGILQRRPVGQVTRMVTRRTGPGDAGRSAAGHEPARRPCVVMITVPINSILELRNQLKWKINFDTTPISWPTT